MSRLTMLFARRYLRSRKSLSVINIISRISIFAVGVPVAAMVILLSVFNGFDSLVRDMYREFDPDILIAPATGKVFDAAEFDALGVGGVKDVEALSHILEESVMAEYRGRQALALFRGVDDEYERVVPMRSLITAGEYSLHDGDTESAIVGQGLAYNLSLRIALANTISVYAPTRGNFSSMLPMTALTTGAVRPVGIFALDAETDSRYTICSLEFMRELLDYDGRSSGVAVKLAGGAAPDKVAAEIRALTGEEYRVLTRGEQRASMYTILKYEKWGIFCIILMVMVIASFSIIGSLVMLIIDKRPDVRILIATGGDIGFVRKIFVGEGMLIGGLGTVAGMAIGVAVCLLQQHFGFVKLGGQTFLVDAYPVVIRLADLAVIAAVTFALVWLIARLTVIRMIPKSLLRL